MGVDDLFLFIVCTIFVGAWIESVGGRRIHAGWGRVYDWILDAIRPTPPHLRGRKPVECGEGTLSVTQLREIVRVERFANRHGSGDDLSGRDDAVRETMSKERAALMANDTPRDWQLGIQGMSALDRQYASEARHESEQKDFARWLDMRQIHPPTVFELEALREHWRRNQMSLPSPAENARRYAAEGGTW